MAHGVWVVHVWIGYRNCSEHQVLITRAPSRSASSTRGTTMSDENMEDEVWKSGMCIHI